jgi:uncharacterized membrane protein
MARLCGVEQLLHRHPYDLSGGEQQRAALAKVLLTEPDILLLDEPTKGLDAACKRTLADLLTQLTDRGAAILIVSHDVEFCAQYAHRCALLFDGAVAAQGPARAFFAGNSFYTTAANRMARHLLPQAVTAEDVIAACGGPPPPAGPSHPPGRPDVPDAPEVSASPPVDAPAAAKRPTSRRAAAGAAISLLCVPLTLLAGLRRGSGYVPLSLAILAECMLPFFLVYEGRRPQARELAVLASLSAIAVAGRAAFFMLPQCKPVMALTILTGVSLGGEAGFLVGAVTMLVSNLLFGQGPWTPWQMFAMGLTGFFAGLLAGPLRRRWALCTFSALAAVALYGGIMNLSTALLAAPQLTWPVWLAYEASGFPMDCVQAAATALFLWIGSGPILEKLERVKRKYSLSD